MDLSRRSARLRESVRGAALPTALPKSGGGKRVVGRGRPQSAHHGGYKHNGYGGNSNRYEEGEEFETSHHQRGTRGSAESAQGQPDVFTHHIHDFESGEGQVVTFEEDGDEDYAVRGGYDGRGNRGTQSNANPNPRPSSAHSKIQRTTFTVNPIALPNDDEVYGIEVDDQQGDWGGEGDWRGYGGRLGTPELEGMGVIREGVQTLPLDYALDYELDDRQIDYPSEQANDYRDPAADYRDDASYDQQYEHAQQYEPAQQSQQYSYIPAPTPHTWAPTHPHDIVSSLITMILQRRQQSSKPLSSIFKHFDRRNCGHFNANDLKDALLDLRLDAHNGNTETIMKQMALNSPENTNLNRITVSYSEFCVFCQDPRHSAFFGKTCAKLAKRRMVDVTECILKQNGGR